MNLSFFLTFWHLLAAGGDPTLSWRTLSTRRLEIHFHQGLEDMARRAALTGERALDGLETLFGRPLEERIEVVLQDSQDAPNGLTNTLPYNLVILFPFPPTSRSDLANDPDWLSVLMVHEFAHVLHLEHAPGLWSWLNAVFGRTFQPAHLHPPWMVEGTATLVESLLSGAGRMGYGPFEAALRAQILDGSELTLAQLAGPTIDIPGGDAPYLYGEVFLGWVGEQYGVRKIIDYYSRGDARLVPFFENDLAREIFGKAWGDLYDEWRAAQRLR